MLAINIDIKPQDGVLFKNPHFLQSSFWAEFKSHHGWKPFQFYVYLKGSDFFEDGVYPLSVLVRSFKGIFSLSYVPLSLVLMQKSNSSEEASSFDSLTEKEKTEEYLEIVQKSAQLLQKYLPKNTWFIRFDPPLCYTNNSNDAVEQSDRKAFAALCKTRNTKKAGSDIQPPDTVLLNLAPDTESLLANMKSKWRYNIRLAQKKNVQIKCCGAEAIDVFYNLYEETSKRDGIALHSKSYYQDLFDTAEKMRAEDSSNPKISMYVASFEDKPLAAIITLFSPEEAVYLYGASSNEHRNLMPAYLLQWTAIQDAKEYGCKTYDFYGIPPTDDEHHPMYGLYRFKTGFGGAIVHRAGSIDIKFSSFYGFYAFAEKLRAIWFKKIKKIFVKKGK